MKYIIVKSLTPKFYYIKIKRKRHFSEEKAIQLKKINT